MRKLLSRIRVWLGRFIAQRGLDMLTAEECEAWTAEKRAKIKRTNEELDRKLTKLAIDLAEDCPTCQQRNRDQFDMLVEVKVKHLGKAICQECGREFSVLTADE